MTEAMSDALTEDALFESLSLEPRIGSDGTVYYCNTLGQMHRLYGPAVEYPDGTREWWQNGRRHRLDAPAVERPDGSRAWYQNGQLHRVDGPAVEYSDGSTFWYQNGRRHRIDGPAGEYPDGYREWYINGKEHTEAEWQQQVVSMGDV